MIAPLVSVVVPMYNDGRTIGLCLDSIYAQDYQPLEVIVVDDASTDDSAASVSKYPCKLVSAVSNGGPGATRNLGVQHASGEVIFFIDADMTMYPDAIANAVRLFQSGVGYGAVFGVPDKVPLFTETLVGQYRILQYHYWRKSAEGLVSGGFYALGAVLRSAFDDAGWFNPSLRQTEEIDHAERLSRRHPMLLTSQISGQLSDESHLWPIVRKAFVRSRLRVPFYLGRGRAMQGMETGGRAFAAVLAALTIASAPVIALSWWAGLATVALLASFVAVDFGQYAFVKRERGWAFLAFFTLVHLVMNTAAVTGLAVGLAQWVVSGRFRTLYRRGLSTSQA